MGFFRKWYLSGVPLIILLIARAFQYFRLQSANRFLDGVIRNEQGLAYVKNALSISAMCSFLTIILAVGLIIAGIIMLFHKNIHFFAFIAHIIVFGISAAFGFALLRPSEEEITNMKVQSTNPNIELRYSSYIEQFQNGDFIIVEPK